MTTHDDTPRDTEENVTDSTDTTARPTTDAVEDVEHHLGGTAAALAGMEVLATPEEPARVVVDSIDSSPTIITLALRSDTVAGRVILQPAQARALADRLVTTADAVERARDNAE